VIRSRALVAPAAVKPAASLDEVYETYRARVFRWALRYAGGQVGWAEDLVHDVFVKVLENLPRLERRAELASWLYRVTANLAIERIRREQSILGRVLRLYQAGREEAATSPHRILEDREEAAHLLDTLRSVPARERVALCMTVFDAMSQREVAKALGLSEGYVSKLVSRAWERLESAGWEVGNDPA